MKKAGKRTRLTPKEARFRDEYLIDLNATKAAIRAGFSAKTARQQGCRLLANVNIAAAVVRAQAKRSERVTVTQDDVVKGLHTEATGAESDAARVSAWGLLGKHLNMFIDRRLVGTMNINDMNEAQLVAFLGLEGLPEEEIAERARGILSAGHAPNRGNGSGRGAD